MPQPQRTRTGGPQVKRGSRSPCGLPAGALFTDEDLMAPRQTPIKGTPSQDVPCYLDTETMPGGFAYERAVFYGATEYAQLTRWADRGATMATRYLCDRQMLRADAWPGVRPTKPVTPSPTPTAATPRRKAAKVTGTPVKPRKAIV